METQFDFIVVGGGSAGCLLANRLSADQRHSVLLIEAGKPDSHPLVHIPTGWVNVAYGEKFNWGYRAAPDKGLNGRSIIWPRAKLMGGCSSTNGMVVVRGDRRDYDHWQSQDLPGWSWDELLPYFKRTESYLAGDPEVRGRNGELHVEEAPHSKISDIYLGSCEQAGIPRNPDTNSGDQFGAGYFQVNIRRGLRQNTSKAFIKPVRKRKNLTIWTAAEVVRVVLDNGIAKGVEVVRDGTTFVVEAQREIILSAGAINSPKLLQLSGIGPQSLLEKYGIVVAADLPGVGVNLQDHLGVVVGHEIIQPLALLSQLKPWRLLVNLWLYLTRRQGILNFPSAHVVAFCHSRQDLPRPDLQIHFTPASGSRDDNGNSLVDNIEGVSAMVYPTRPKSRGTVEIASSDPAAAPLITANYLAEDYDRTVTIAGVRKLRAIFAAQPFAGVAGKEIRPGATIQSDEQILEYARNHSTTSYHPVGTCKMGTDQLAVVDAQLRVRGVGALRVVDASVMPDLVSGNTHIAALVIAEKAADMLLAAHA
ncbi:hypothetical protein E3W66_02220 [Gammaproteobacteria bacterium LSUCC0057]|uniref:Glucose-methanol-choline oxidoreductase N-terminal domain-containing protein n=1 Tax=Gammaproteobacteria bacterium LSUCC0057 TaxID=2559237 RepID=A0A4Y8UMC7_9GAMM|nr:hypothetical protein E3W66_02220 [Gammaproteobacteria bacterium LSUCC0057]